jgi:predicted kinase
MEAVIFTGIQGSGKTTFYRERFFDTHVRISLDVLRTRHREQLLLVACLEGKQPFVIDNTNPTAGDRARYVCAAKAAGFRVASYFFETSLRDAIRRNNQRSGKKKIAIPGVAGTFKKLQPPTPAEGFDKQFVVTIRPEGGFAVAQSPVE